MIPTVIMRTASVSLDCETDNTYNIMTMAKRMVGLQRILINISCGNKHNIISWVKLIKHKMDEDSIIVTGCEQKEDETQKYINIIVSQTNYSMEKAGELWIETNGDYMKVIKDYLNIRQESDTEDKPKKIRSLNQEIYKHIRSKMNENMDVVISRMNGGI